MISITHNDDDIQIPENLNVWKFLEFMNVKHPKYVVVELNGDILSQKEWETTFIKENDDISHDYLAGGG